MHILRYNHNNNSWIWRYMETQINNFIVESFIIIYQLKQVLERQLPLVLCSVGWFYTFTIGSLSSFLSAVDTRDSVLAQKMAAVNEFIKETNFSGEIKQKI